jgi:hypothetical protein
MVGFARFCQIFDENFSFMRALEKTKGNAKEKGENEVMKKKKRERKRVRTRV